MSWANSNRAQRLPTDWPAIRRATLARDGHTCQIRGPRCTRRATEVDHIVAGDDHHPSNLRAVCATCHASKSGTEGGTAYAARVARSKRPPEPHPGLRGGG